MSMTEVAQKTQPRATNHVGRLNNFRGRMTNSLGISAEFPSEKHLLAPLRFLLKSIPLRQPPPSLRLAGRIQRLTGVSQQKVKNPVEAALRLVSRRLG
jgi:hypothetical protein